MAAATLAFAPAAHAAHTIQYNPGPNGSFTAAFENEDPADEFEDVFAPFTITTEGVLGGTISTEGTGLNDLDLEVALVEGDGTTFNFFPLFLNTDAVQFGSFTGRPIGPGTYTLRVAGTSAVNGSYAGTLSFNAVPEPGTWGMMLIGFGALGFAMRRRRKDNVRVRFAL